MNIDVQITFPPEVIEALQALAGAAEDIARALADLSGVRPQPTAEPPAPPVVAPAPPADATKPGLIATPERKAIIARDYPRGVPIKDMLAEINALPGPAMGGNGLAVYANNLGLRRPGSAAPAPKEIASNPAPKAGPRVNPAPEEITPQPRSAALQSAAAATKLSADAFKAPASNLALPGKSDDGKVYANRRQIADWASRHRLRFDGDMLPVNKMRKMMRLPEIVLDETV